MSVWRKAITIRFGENYPISHDTTNEYKKIYSKRNIAEISVRGGHFKQIACLTLSTIQVESSNLSQLTPTVDDFGSFPCFFAIKI